MVYLLCTLFISAANIQKLKWIHDVCPLPSKRLEQDALFDSPFPRSTLPDSRQLMFSQANYSLNPMVPAKISTWQRDGIFKLFSWGNSRIRGMYSTYVVNATIFVGRPLASDAAGGIHMRCAAWPSLSPDCIRWPKPHQTCDFKGKPPVASSALSLARCSHKKCFNIKGVEEQLGVIVG